MSFACVDENEIVTPIDESKNLRLLTGLVAGLRKWGRRQRERAMVCLAGERCLKVRCELYPQRNALRG
jgi:hypothetical protein